MDVQAALTEAKAYQDTAWTWEDRAAMLIKTSKSVYKNSKHLRASIKNLKSIYKSLFEELERSRLQASGNVIDQSLFLAFKNLELSQGYQRQAQSKLSQIQPLDQQAALIKDCAELVDYSFVSIVKSLKQLQRKK